MKALALPGYALNKTIMKIQMGSMHDLISKYYDIEYLDPSYETNTDLLPPDLVP